MTQNPLGCGVDRKQSRPLDRQNIRISRTHWHLARHMATSEYGMPVGRFMGLVLENFIRHRWPLDLGLTPSPSPLKGAEGERSELAGSGLDGSKEG